MTNRKNLILHEHKIDDGETKTKIHLNGGAAPHTVLTETDDQKLFSLAMTPIKSTASYISQTI